MSAPTVALEMLEAIYAGDEAQAERLARQWQRECDAAVQRIRWRAERDDVAHEAPPSAASP